MTDSPQCESHEEDGSQCENDAIGKWEVTLFNDGETLRTVLWLCTEHRFEIDPVESVRGDN